MRSDDLITFGGQPCHPPAEVLEPVPTDDLAAFTDRPIASLIDLRGKVALVTGAAQGFGYACARRLAEAGAAILLADVRRDRLGQAEERLSADGRDVASAVGDETTIAHA